MVTVNESLIREILDRLIRLETLVEGNTRATNQRIDDTNNRITDTNNRIDETNTRLDNQVTELRREFRSEFRRLTYLILGTGAAIIAAVVATQLFG